MIEKNNAALFPKESIEKEIKNNLKIMITAYRGSKITIDLYKGTITSNDACDIIIDNK